MSDALKRKAGGARPGPTFQALLDNETQDVPASLRASAPLDLGSAPLSTERYLQRHWHDREKQLLWPRVWQAVCRETEIAMAGDYYVHDIAGTSVLAVRTQDGSIRVYPNACLHRGRQLKSGGPNGSGHSQSLICPFHGFRWTLDGSFAGAPCEWDFSHIDKDNFDLPQLRSAAWGGWLFVNIDGNAPPLDDYLGVVPAHFERWEPEACYKALHIKKVLRCNWKLAHEAFIESFHTVATHPQLLPYTGDTVSQYDCFSDTVSRTITPMGVVSSHLPDTTQQQAVHQWLSIYGVEVGADGPPALPANSSARAYLGEMNIERLSALYGRSVAHATHSEVLDAILYSVFPNFAPWGGFRPNVTYRFLPYDDDHQQCTMEIMLLMRFAPESERPADAPVQFVPADQTLADTPGIEPGLAQVFDQDFANLPLVQKGLHTQFDKRIHLANYQEVRIRHFNNTLDKYVYG